MIEWGMKGTMLAHRLINGYFFDGSELLGAVGKEAIVSFLAYFS
jgi:hypothetical protein